MFTGIIEEIGMIAQIQKKADSARLSIKGATIFEDMKLGDSIAVNGVCLTVTNFGGNLFSADVMNETLKRSNLGDLNAGRKVNLERAMRADGRFGGHIVSGHIDGIGHIIEKKNDGNAIWITIGAEESLLKYIVEKGSIAIDGISLTVATITTRSFSVSVIPHTGSMTTLTDKNVGESVNLENDIVGKYIERFLSFKEKDTGRSSGISLEFLAQAGF
ncbi:MAG: riboflavin synthase [Eubacteriales bacterium]|nr:riboflavin synthase [Eubacteriales bacterium]MDD3349242.1 riboflavin synthase [Eubacteriales bacterium]